MLGTIVNTLAIMLGGFIGLFLKKGINEKVNKTVMQGLALCVIYIGLDGIFKANNAMIIIISMSLGGFIGETIDIDKRINNFGNKLESKFKNGNGKISEGFVTCTLMYCVGAMAILGAIEGGLQGKHDILFSKSILDGISSIIFASTLGIGVLLSGFSVLIYQGLIVFGSSFLSPLLSTAVIGNITACGSLLIIALGFNMLGITKIKVSNLLPAVFLPIIISVLGF